MARKTLSKKGLIHFTSVFVPVVILCAIALGTVLTVDYARLRGEVEDAEFRRVSLLVAAYHAFFTVSHRDLKLLAKDSVLGAYAAGREDLIDTLHDIYLNFANSQTAIFQIRLVDLDGNEKIRVDVSEGNANLTSRDALQSIKNRYYFTETLGLNEGEIYVSDFDLNVENGVIEEPIQPVIRIATPVFDSNGERWGMLILNIDGKPLVGYLANANNAGGAVLSLLNREGYWLQGPLESENWAFMYADRSELSLAEQQPQLWNLLQTIPEAMFYHNEDLYIRIPLCADLACQYQFNLDGDSDSAAPISLPDSALLMLSHIPAEQLTMATLLRPVISQWAILGLLLLVIAAIVGVLAWRLAASVDTLESQGSTLKESLSLLDAFFARNPTVMFVKDLNDRYVSANRAFKSISKNPELAVENTVTSDHFYDHVAKQMKQQELEVLASRSAKEFTLKLEKDGDVRYFNILRFPMLDQHGEVNAIGGIAFEISDRKKMEISLEESNRALENFAYSASHDLQEPLRKISAFAGRLEERLADKLDDEASIFELGRISDAAKRMGTMIRSLLELSRYSSQDLQAKRVKMSELVQQVEEDLSPMIAESGATIVLEEDCLVSVDSDAFQQVLRNLISNSIYYAGENKPPEIRLSNTPNGSSREIQISDNGIGFDPAHNERVFEPFRRLTTGNTKRSGLGLAICRQIVKRHSGEIKAASIPGVGTTFTISLPASQLENQANVRL